VTGKGSGVLRWADHGPLLIKVEPFYLKQKWVLHIAMKYFIKYMVSPLLF